MIFRLRFWFSIFAALSTGSLFALPPEVDPAKELPRFPAVEPTNAVSTFQIKPGFRLELVASEPLIVDPIALAFDENGRMFVVEMRDYSERRDERLGRIKMLEDTDGDGKFDKSTVYVDGLPWPTAVTCYDGGIFVGSTPDIFYFKDTDGDGKADVRKHLFSGFGNTKDRLNVQALMNSFNWGLDNRIHGLTAPNGGIVTNLVRKSDKPLNLNNLNFSIDPRTMEMLPETGGGQYGMSFNTRGRKFTCSNSEHLMSWMYDAHYADRNPYYAMPKSLVSIAVDGGAAEVFRISPEEPWRVIRTKWRVSGIASGPIEGGGRASGYFTGATGATIYRGNAFPAEFLDNAFTGDAGGNLVHRKMVYSDDVGVKAKRPADEQNVEFLASKDTWFRPAQFANAPDGTFYVIDIYREIIEHPWSLPEQLKKHMDLNSGNNRGRIYRIVPENFKQPKPVQFGKMKPSQWVSLLEHSNGWHRETAARLIYQKQDKTIVPALRKLAQNSKSNLGRMHALYALDGLNALTENDVIRALRDRDDLLREHGIKFSEKFLRNGAPSPELWNALRDLPKDNSLHVVFQLALTLGEIRHGERNNALAQCLERDLQSSWMRAAVLSSLAEGAGEMFSTLSKSQAFLADPNGQEFLAQLSTLIGTKKNPAEISEVLGFIGRSQDFAQSVKFLHGLSEGLQRSGSSLAQVDGENILKGIYARASEVIANVSAPLATRLQAIQLLGSADYDFASATLLDLLNQNQPQEIQLAALTTLGHFNDARVATEIVNRWKNFSPRLRSEAVSILAARPERALILLQAIQNDVARQSDLSTAQQKFLRTHRDANVRAKANAVLGAASVVSKRQDVLNEFSSALHLKGDAARGKVIYLERCFSCHRLEGQGFALGPDLVTVQNTGKEKMLLNILDPNREVAPQFQAYEVETKDGDTVIGLIANESATSVMVRQAYGKEDTVLRANIKKMQSQNQSLMPEGLEAGLNPQAMADLLEYVATAPAEKRVEKP